MSARPAPGWRITGGRGVALGAHALALSTLLGVTTGLSLAVHAGATGLRPGDFVAVSPASGYSVNGSNSLLVTLDGTSLASRVISAGGYLIEATDVCVPSPSEVLVTVAGTGVVRIDPSTGVQSVFASAAVLGDGRASGIAVAQDGSLFISMQGTLPRVVRLKSDGGFDGIVTSNGLLTMPAGLCFGRDGELYVSVTIPYGAGQGGGIAHVDPSSGAQTAVAGMGVLIGPFHIACAPDGSLWSAQYGGHSLGRGACVVRTKVSDGTSEVLHQFECEATGVAIRSDGVAVVGDCYMINGECGGSAQGYMVADPSGAQATGVSGPVAVVPDVVTPALRRSWGHLKSIYR